MATGTIMAEPRLRRDPAPAESTAAHGDAPASDALTTDALRKLLAWLSPSFPVGGFSYSHGLEWAIEDGTVRNTIDLEKWLADILRHGTGWTDAVLFCQAYRAATDENATALIEINALAVAFQPSRERHLETTAQGRAFLSTVLRTWPNETLARLGDLFPEDAPVSYSIAIALACAAHGIPLTPAVNAWLGAFAANLVSAAVRAVPLGQTEGQRLIADLSPQIEGLVTHALDANLDDLGGAALRADIASMKHETQYTRLFRS
jgi:urease accessory protein